MNLKKISLILVLSILIIFFFFNIAKSLNIFSKVTPSNIGHIEINGVGLSVYKVTSEKDQKKGLSGRESLRNDEGMFFIFPKIEEHLLWMKEMKFPIDMIWFDGDLNVIYVEKNVSPESYPSTFGPSEGSKYVLETNANFFEKNNLKIGDNAIFLP